MVGSRVQPLWPGHLHVPHLQAESEIPAPLLPPGSPEPAPEHSSPMVWSLPVCVARWAVGGGHTHRRLAEPTEVYAQVRSDAIDGPRESDSSQKQGEEDHVRHGGRDPHNLGEHSIIRRHQPPAGRAASRSPWWVAFCREAHHPKHLQGAGSAKSLQRVLLLSILKLSQGLKWDR